MADRDSERPGRRCVLCGERAGSREHAIPGWLLEHINPSGEVLPVELPNGKVVATDVVTRMVCHVCNTRWLAERFENRVAPLVKAMDAGERQVLAPNDLRLLGAWAYKTMLMLECATEGGPNFSLEELGRFRRSGHPRENASIVLAAFVEQPAILYRRWSGELQVDPRWPADRFYSATLLAGHLVFSIVGDLRVPAAHARLMKRHIAQELLPVWPGPGRGVRWPPEYGLDRAKLVELVNVFGDDFTPRFLE